MATEGAFDGHLLELGRGAYAAARWSDAHEHLSAADRSTNLSGPDLELLAVAAYLLGEDTESANAWGRAHEAWRAQDELLAAARCAFWAGWGLFYKGQAAQAQGWFGTAEALVDRLGGDNPVRGLLLVRLH